MGCWRLIWGRRDSALGREQPLRWKAGYIKWTVIFLESKYSKDNGRQVHHLVRERSYKYERELNPMILN